MTTFVSIHDDDSIIWFRYWKNKTVAGVSLHERNIYRAMNFDHDGSKADDNLDIPVLRMDGMGEAANAGRDNENMTCFVAAAAEV